MQLLGDRRFALPALSVSLVIGGLYAFFASAPTIMIRGMGYSSLQLGLFFAATVLVVFSAGILAPRLAQRWGLSDGSNVARTEQDLKHLFPKQHWNRLHLQIIFWGREFCTARGCDGTVCSICRELYPKRRRPVITRKP